MKRELLHIGEDSRGWYIVTEGGINYLYSDGEIRSSVSANPPSQSKAFWPSRKAAEGFLDEWLHSGKGHKPKRFRLIQDNNGHWYVISSGPEVERIFNDWCKAMETGEFNDPYGDPMIFLPFENMMVDGPHTVTFDEWKEG